MSKKDQKSEGSKAKERTRIQTPPSPEFGGNGDEPWRKYRVQPDTSAMPLDTEIDPERGIGARIAFCRGQLDNLSVEALSRYTKKFDRDGISRTTLVRYESGDFLPGARELRILVDTLWVPAWWLLSGRWEISGISPAAVELLEAFGAFVDERTGAGLPTAARDMVRRDSEGRQAEVVAQRQRWLYEARNPGAGSG